MPLDSLIPLSRDLTRDEVFLLGHLLRHSAPEDREKFTPQIFRARVVGRCDCGCPTLFLALDGNSPVSCSPVSPLPGLPCIGPAAWYPRTPNVPQLPRRGRPRPI